MAGATTTTSIIQNLQPDLTIQTFPAVRGSDNQIVTPERFALPVNYQSIVQRYFSAVKSIEDLIEMQKFQAENSEHTVEFEKLMRQTRLDSINNTQREIYNYFFILANLVFVIVILIAFVQRRMRNELVDTSIFKLVFSAAAAIIFIYLTTWYFIIERNRQN